MDRQRLVWWISWVLAGATTAVFVALFVVQRATGSLLAFPLLFVLCCGLVTFYGLHIVVFPVEYREINRAFNRRWGMKPPATWPPPDGVWPFRLVGAVLAGSGLMLAFVTLWSPP